MNDGTCTESSNGYTCKSAPGYTGVNSETSMSDFNAMKGKLVKHYKDQMELQFKHEYCLNIIFLSE